jgi:hypothetical protein
MSKDKHPILHGEAKRPPMEAEDEELVLTPAGYVPKTSVHAVGPNETVVFNEDGTFTIVQIRETP